MQAGANSLGTDVALVTIGTDHTCAKKTDGTLWCWGKNDMGQLGIGTTNNSPTPTQVGPSILGNDVMDVELADSISYARKRDGTIWSWGLYVTVPSIAGAVRCDANDATCGVNETQESSPADCRTATCGDGKCMRNETSQNCPSDCKMAVQVAVGGGHSCARKSDGTLWCWGGNYCGQLGINQFSGVYAAKPLPMQAGAFTIDSDVAEVALGGKQFVTDPLGPRHEHSCALKKDGSLWCWGNNDYGQLGNATTTSASIPVPTPPILGNDVAEVSLGWYHTCARKTDNTAWCWGANSMGQLGNGTTSNVPFPVQVGLNTLGSNVAQIRAGGETTCARKTDGTVWCWGRGTIDIANPQQVAGLGNTVVDIAVGSSHACARKNDGTLWCWGFNSLGQLGIGNTDSINTVVQTGATTLGNNVAQVALGTDFGCAIKTDGTLWCWGQQLHGEIGNGSDETTGSCQTTPVQIGANTLGNKVAGVALGDGHACALKDDGTVWCWGEAPGMFEYSMFNYRYPVEVPWCGDGICTLHERDNDTCPDCTPKVGDGVCDPFLNCVLLPELPAWECDTDCACDDGDKCTQPDTLHNGICVGVSPVKCPADGCHDVAGVCDPATGQCSNSPKPDGTACPGGACHAGICVPDGSDSGSANGASGSSANGSGASSGASPNNTAGCSCDMTGGSLPNTAAWLSLGLLLLVRRKRTSA